MPNSKPTPDSLKPQALRVLEMLEQAGGHGVTNGSFIREYIARFGGRIKELRDAGYKIETAREGQGCFRYTLTDSSGVGAANREGDGHHSPTPRQASGTTMSALRRGARSSRDTDPGGATHRSTDGSPGGMGGLSEVPAGELSLFDLSESSPTPRRYSDPEEQAA